MALIGLLRRGTRCCPFWLGHKLHVTETCDAPPCSCCQAAAAGGPAAKGMAAGERGGHDKTCAHPAFPNLITHVGTTDAAVTDNQMTGVTHDDLAGKNLPPGRHYLDSGYLSAALVVSEAARHGIALIGPLLADTSAQARAGAFQADYARRAGVEGTMHQAASHGARRARYGGLPKTRLDHVYMASALNFLRLHAYWTGTPLDRPPDQTHLAQMLSVGLLLMVERVASTVRYVPVEGPVTRAIRGTDELLREITVRYLPRPEKVTAYIEFARAEYGEQVAIYLRPQQWLSAELGPG